MKSREMQKLSPKVVAKIFEQQSSFFGNSHQICILYIKELKITCVQFVDKDSEVLVTLGTIKHFIKDLP